MNFSRILGMTALVCALAVSALTSEAQDGFSPQLDLRIRQEVFDGVFHFAPDTDRNQLRFRSRAGFKYTQDQHTFKLLLTNETRRYINPDNLENTWDEIIIDQFYWQWQGEASKLTVGRQNIIWDDGFLMLESRPYDGSRSIFQNAARWQTSDLDLSFILNQKRDPWVLAGDEDRAMRDADEMALAARYQSPWGMVKFIGKKDQDPDNTNFDKNTYTLAYRATAGCKCNLWWMGEVAGQYLTKDSGYDHFDFALQTRLEFPLGGNTQGTAGLFHYGENFLTPWGRWPLWSELYIYTLIGESTPSRVHVAAWEDVAATFVGLTHEFSETTKGKARAYYLTSPDADFESRGLLIQTRLDFQLNKHAKGHLTWEMLNPGDFHLNHPELTDKVHFLRWEIILSL